MDEATRLDWGRRIKNRRGPITQERLAELIGGDQSTISRIERGKVDVSDDMKWKLAGALGCTVEDLFPWPAVRPPFQAEVSV
jgi:transcriptional regulator with XRE-family HTH domain